MRPAEGELDLVRRAARQQALEAGSSRPPAACPGTRPGGLPGARPCGPRRRGRPPPAGCCRSRAGHRSHSPTSSPVLVRPRPGSSTGKRVSSAKIRVELMTCRRKRRHSGSSHQQARPTQSHKRGAVELDPLPGEDLRLAVERQEIGVLGHQHVRQQGLGRHPAGDRPLRCGGLHHRLLAGPAAIAGSADHLHPQLGGDDVEHLARVLADRRARPRRSRGSSCPRRRPGPRSAAGAPARRPGCAAEPGASEGCCSLQPPPPAPPRRPPRSARGPPGRAAAGRGRAAPSAGRTARAAAAGSRAAASRSRLVPRRARHRAVSRSVCNDASEAFCWAMTSAICCRRSSSRSGSRGRSSSTSDMALFYWPKAEKASTSAHQAVLGRGIARGWSRCHGKPSSRVASCARSSAPRLRPARAS